MKLSSKNPIGIFDSGIGGTSIWKEIHKLLPDEHSIYLSDSKNAPYGEKSKKEIIELSVKNTEFLLTKHCKIIVIACNTATTNAIKLLRQRYTIPFIGIEPAIKPAALQSNTKVIGILATQGTLHSQLFEKTASNISKSLRIVEQQGEGLVELIEQGKINSAKTNLLLKKYLQPMLKANADHIVLGCSHYPYLREQIQKLAGNSVKIIDSGFAVARQTQKVLKQHNLLNTESANLTNIFYINKSKTVLLKVLQNHTKKIVKELNF
ncbi:MAG: glutamate racemase [Tenacibaculum sp.]